MILYNMVYDYWVYREIQCLKYQNFFSSFKEVKKPMHLVVQEILKKWPKLLHFWPLRTPHFQRASVFLLMVVDMPCVLDKIIWFYYKISYFCILSTKETKKVFQACIDPWSSQYNPKFLKLNLTISKFLHTRENKENMKL